jgi:hypothetical protein
MRFSHGMHATPETTWRNSVMKKVRYMIGAVATAPALGMMLPTTNATATVMHPQKSTAKTVSLAHNAMTVATATCNPGNILSFAFKTSTNGHFRGAISYVRGGTCVKAASGILDHEQSNLEMRTRAYSAGGARVFQNYHRGYFSNNATHFSIVVDRYAHQVCEALVNAGNLASVKYGPVCENT